MVSVKTIKNNESSENKGFDMDTFKKLNEGKPYTKKANWIEEKKMKRNIGINPKYIIKIKGQDYVTYNGLLDLAHRLGLVDLRTELIHFDENKHSCIFKAHAVLQHNESDPTDHKVLTFTGYGHTDENNLKGFTKQFYIVMAETRAKARVLRDALNIDMCSVEELDSGIR